MTVSCLPAPLTAGRLPPVPLLGSLRARRHVESAIMCLVLCSQSLAHDPSAPSFPIRPVLTSSPLLLAPILYLVATFPACLPTAVDRDTAHTNTCTRANRGVGTDGDSIVLASRTVCVFVVIVERSQIEGEEDGEEREE